MTGYDPQAERKRPRVSSQSPVDDLLGHINGSEDGMGGSGASVDGIEDAIFEDQVYHPFETPPIEMTDERADLIHRLLVLGLVAALVAGLAVLRRKRSSS
tara:strand:+ start:297 stop:596 length:300 start_codon:yes stop_codon:yes gene_type:complete